MQLPTPDERRLMAVIRQRTGKSMHGCLFCLRLARGDLQRALEFCDSGPAEDDRQGLAR